MHGLIFFFSSSGTSFPFRKLIFLIAYLFLSSQKGIAQNSTIFERQQTNKNNKKKDEKHSEMAEINFSKKKNSTQKNPCDSNGGFFFLYKVDKSIT